MGSRYKLNNNMLCRIFERVKGMRVYTVVGLSVLLVGIIVLLLFPWLCMHRLWLCGYPIEVHHRTSGELLNWFVNPPSDFVLPADACLAGNYESCNKNCILFSFGSGKLLFSNADHFCSDEDRSLLRSLYISRHLWWLAIFGLFVGCFLWLVRKLRRAKSTNDITHGSS